MLISFLHATFMKIGENYSAHEIRFKKPNKYSSYVGGGHIFVKRLAVLVSVYKNTHTGLKCLNANVVMLHNCRGGRGIFFIFFYFFDHLHLQIIASISPKTSVENSSAQWAIFYFSNTVCTTHCYFSWKNVWRGRGSCVTSCMSMYVFGGKYNWFLSFGLT